jgi:ABC-type branched-subunit amino acid transport system substrate-binding protein
MNRVHLQSIASCVALAALPLALACAAPRPAPNEAESRAYHHASAQAKPDAEARALREFLAQYPESALASDAAMRLAELAQKRRNPSEAEHWYRTLLDRYSDSDQADQARLRLAGLAAKQGQLGKVRSLLERLRFSKLESQERSLAYRMLADASEDPVQKLRWLAQLRGEGGSEPEELRIDAEIEGVARGLSLHEHLRAAEALEREVAAGLLWVSGAERALDQGDALLAEHAVQEAGELPLAPAVAARYAGVAERVKRAAESGATAAVSPLSGMPGFAFLDGLGSPDVSNARGTLGVVLPLSGRLARFGEQSLQGILLAAGVFGGDPARASSGMRILIRDSAGRGDRAAEAVRELAANGDVAAIVGPLVSDECEAAASEAEAAGIPLLALNSKEDLVNGRQQVFRVRTTPREEVEAVVSHAFETLGARRFAMLYPKDKYGLGLRALFWDAVLARGGEIVATSAFEPGSTDFAAPIKRLVGYELLTPEEQAALDERKKLLERARRLPTAEAKAAVEAAKAMTAPDGSKLPPIVDFDALFIPASHEQIVLIAPQLAFHEVKGAVLLGTSGWYSPDLVRLAREYLQKAVFPAHYFPGSQTSFVQQFTRDYAQAFESAPTEFSAQAFDAANLALIQLAQGVDSRDDLREGLRESRAHPGASGVISISEDGNAHKRPFLLSVQGKEFVQLAP